MMSQHNTNIFLNTPQSLKNTAQKSYFLSAVLNNKLKCVHFSSASNINNNNKTFVLTDEAHTLSGRHRSQDSMAEPTST